MRKEIRDIVKKREIGFLLHFTRIENLDSILTKGLLSTSRQDQEAIDSLRNDQLRIDGQPSSISLSLNHPNYKMFYRMRCEQEGTEWAVVCMKRSMLWNTECAFCPTNAASGSVITVPIESLKTPDALERLFDERLGKPSRQDLKLGSGAPTDPQAEVLVFDDIDPKFILGAITQKKSTEVRLKGLYPQFQFAYNRHYFYPRSDYAHWKI